jgi:hypothetical protein
VTKLQQKKMLGNEEVNSHELGATIGLTTQLFQIMGEFIISIQGDVG